MKKCKHNWSYAPAIYLTYPARQDRICRLCGKQEIITIGTKKDSENDYEQVLEKFKEQLNGTENQTKNTLR